MKKIFLDSDVILDFFLQRNSHYAAALKLFELINRSKYKAYITAVVFSNVNYILSQDAKQAKVLKNLSHLCSLVKTITLGDKALEFAINSGFNDIEDAIQYYAAIDAKLDCIVSRNKKDYKKSKIPVLTAEEFLAHEDL